MRAAGSALRPRAASSSRERRGAPVAGAAGGVGRGADRVTAFSPAMYASWKTSEEPVTEFRRWAAQFYPAPEAVPDDVP